jgi:hypothetical protein
MQSRRVYVGNLSWDVAWQDLKDHMRQAGRSSREVIMELNGRSKGAALWVATDGGSSGGYQNVDGCTELKAA